MGRPATKPTELRDGFYIEVRNKGSKNGIRLRRESQKRGHDNKQRSLGRNGFAAGCFIKVFNMCTSPKRERPDVVHLAQQ